MEIPRRGWRYGYFWNYTLKKHNRGEQKLFSAVRYGTNVSISVHTTGIFFTLNPTKVPGYLQSTQFRDEHPDNPGHKNALITCNGFVEVACEAQTHFRSSLLSLRKIAIFRRERSDDRKCVCASQATVEEDLRLKSVA